tara:strand:- start:1224 stop:1391 length:168 start_codon:yes stop_codon:yes gene_type:complete
VDENLIIEVSFKDLSMLVAGIHSLDSIGMRNVLAIPNISIMTEISIKYNWKTARI